MKHKDLTPNQVCAPPGRLHHGVLLGRPPGALHAAARAGCASELGLVLMWGGRRSRKEEKDEEEGEEEEDEEEEAAEEEEQPPTKLGATLTLQKKATITDRFCEFFEQPYKTNE